MQKGKTAVASFRRDVLLQASGNTAAQIIGVLGIPVLTRLYSPEQFALQALFVQCVTLVAILTTLRLENFVPLPKRDFLVRSIRAVAFAAGVVATIIFTIAVWVFKGRIADLLGNPDIALWLPLAPISAFAVAWAAVEQSTRQRHGDFRTSGISEVVSKSAYVGMGLLGSIAHLGSIGLLATTASSALGKIMFLRRSGGASRFDRWGKPRSIPSLRVLNSVVKHYGRMSASLVVSGLLTTYAIATPLIAVSRLYGPEVLGQLSLVTMTLYLPAGLIGAAIGQVYYQRAAAMWCNGGRIRELWVGTSTQLVILSLPLYIVAALLAPVAYPTLFGAKWGLAGEMAVWMSLPACISLVSSSTDRTCLIVGAWWYPLIWHLFRAISSTLLVFFAIKLNWTVATFVSALAVKLTLVYAVDLAMQYYFSMRTSD